MRLAFLALLVLPLAAPAAVTVNEDVTAVIDAQRIQVQVTGTDPELVSLVKSALGMHGAFNVVASGSVRVNIDRAGNSARVSCDASSFAFSADVQARDLADPALRNADLALRVADAAVVNVGRKFSLRPLFADTRVAFLARRDGDKRGHNNVYAGDLLMRAARPLTQLACTNLGPHWSADGSRVLFVSYTKGFGDLYAASYPPGGIRPLIADMKNGLMGGAASPDGSRLAFCSSNLGVTLDLYVCDANGRNRRCILRSDDRVESDACWSPEGAQIIFASGSTSSPRLFVIPASGGTPTPVSTGGGYASEPSWNRVDRNLIAFTQASGGNSVLVLDQARATVTAAAKATGSISYSRGSWCADGRHLVVQSQQGDSYWLSLADAATGKVTRITGGQLSSCSQPDCWFPRR